MSLTTLADFVGAAMPSGILAVLFEAALKGSLLLGLAWVVTRVLRGASAAFRHLVWASALGGMLLLPLLTKVVPRVEVAGLPTMARETAVAVPALLAVERAIVAVEAPPATPPTVYVEQADVAPPATLSVSSIPRFAALAWLTIASLVLLRLFAGTLRLSNWSRRASPVDDGAWLALVQRLALRLGITRPVTLLRSERACVPMTWGVVYPTVLLPIDADEWSSDRRTIVLLHELAHVKRFDAFTQLIAQLAVALFWFNPLVWYAARQMRTEREHACDDCVLEGGARATDYAYDLLQIARSLGGSSAPAAAALAMARRSEFEGRLLAILDPKTKRHSVSRARLALATLTVFILALPLSALTSAQAASVEAAVAVEVAPAVPEVPPAVPIPPVPERADVAEPVEATAPMVPSMPELPATISALTPAPVAAATPALSGMAKALIAQVTPLERIVQAGTTRLPPPDRETLIAVVKQAAKMTSDFEKAELLIAVAKHYIRDDELRSAYLDAVGTLTSSYEQSRTLLPLMLKDDLPSHAMAEVVKIAGRMSSDNDKASLLVKTITDHGAVTLSVRDAIIASAGTIGSGHERGRVVSAILKRGGLTNMQAIDLIEVVQKISSSNDKANALIELTNRHSLDDKQVRDAFMRAAETISSAYDYRRVISSVLK